MKDRESLPEGKIQPEADSPTKLVREGSTDLKGVRHTRGQQPRALQQLATCANKRADFENTQSEQK
ncbi:unnamed protein product [Fusarium graminearum]|uniref:Uncharacterized protein n=1 Tax=Gibberella zeae TaxID=5518 RepID=A0A4E9DTU2_GIBZA|nr:unnamed protein product [Fusarium graminearum]CAG2011386.1 unnamed protein product [Fusarium graminearum]